MSSQHTHSILLFLIIFNSFLFSQEWQKINPVFEPPGNYDASYGHIIDENRGWIVEYFPGRIWHTRDGGYNWALQMDSSNAWIHDLFFTDSLHGWALQEETATRDHYILISKTGGKTWDKYPSPPIFTIYMLDSLKGFAGGDSIFKTVDGGLSWNRMSVFPDIFLSIIDFFFVDSLHGWAVGANNEWTDMGIILKTDDGGDSWKINVREASVYGYAVFFTDTLCGYVAGSNPPYYQSVITSTKDGGDTWTTQYISDITGGSWINDITFLNDSTGYCVGDYGFAWKTNDSGLTWQLIDLPTDDNLQNISFSENNNTGFIVGWNNTIFKCTKAPTSLEYSLQTIPTVIHLEQNYPNPFNPKTIIQYTARAHRDAPLRVDLSIYNILGQKIETLVSEKQQAGSYKVQWDASKLSSGVYLYRLQAGNYVETRKMILMK